jgi:hypothetical protein
MRLMADLRAMGETGVLAGPSGRPLTRRHIARALELYAQHFPAPGGRVAATFEILFLTAWAPHPSQQKPARRGSGRVDLGGLLGRS